MGLAKIHKVAIETTLIAMPGPSRKTHTATHLQNMKALTDIDAPEDRPHLKTIGTERHGAHLIQILGAQHQLA